MVMMFPICRRFLLLRRAKVRQKYAVGNERFLIAIAGCGTGVLGLSTRYRLLLLFNAHYDVYQSSKLQ